MSLVVSSLHRRGILLLTRPDRSTETLSQQSLILNSCSRTAKSVFQTTVQSNNVSQEGKAAESGLTKRVNEDSLKDQSGRQYWKIPSETRQLCRKAQLKVSHPADCPK